MRDLRLDQRVFVMTRFSGSSLGNSGRASVPIAEAARVFKDPHALLNCP